MQIFLGSDHGGFALKRKIYEWLSQKDFKLEDCGAFALNEEDDYPDFAFSVAQKVAQNLGSRGILFCRSGAGMVIAANKINGVRAVDAYDERSARHAVEHNDANIISLSGDWVSEDEAQKIISAFLSSEFSKEERHQRRLDKISKQEQA